MAPQTSSQLTRGSEATGAHTLLPLECSSFEANYDKDGVKAHIYQGPETRARKKKRDAAGKLTQNLCFS
jgi:hypothetical protein